MNKLYKNTVDRNNQTIYSLNDEINEEKNLQTRLQIEIDKIKSDDSNGIDSKKFFALREEKYGRKF